MIDERILMYTGEGEGWASTTVALTSLDIEEKVDKTDPKYLNPTKVSIPSPFARFDLVKNAFINVARGINVSKRDKLLVSHALDVAQLYFEGGDFKIIQWDAIVSPKDLNANDQQKLYGKTLRLYVGSEKKLGLNNEENSTIYILATKANEPIGCTSPVSLFMPTPNIRRIRDRRIMINGDKVLFDEEPRPLYLRDENFVRYIFALAYSFKNEDRLKGFCDYVESQKDLIRKIDDTLFTNVSREEETFAYYNSLRDNRENTIRICGLDIKVRNKADEKLQVENSDFVIQTSKSSQKPLVLSNNFTMPNATYFGNVKWDKKKHALDYAYGKDKMMKLYTDLGQIRTELPGTSTTYEDGWLCESDFLEDCLVQLPYALDDKHFYSAFTSKDRTRSYLFPIRPKYFDYFDWQDLVGNNALSIEETKVSSDGKKISEVVVSLKIPVAKGHVILKKTYYYEAKAIDAINCPIFADEIQPEAKGKIITASKVALTIFPFAKLASTTNHYRIQLVSDISNRDFDISLRAYNSGGEVQFDPSKEFKRGHHKYYGISNDIDYFDIVYSGEKGYQIHAYLIPDWGKALKGGATKFRFGFDFGTSNSHIAVAELNSEGTPEMKKEAITIEKSIVSTISPTSATPLQHVAPQEFLPLENSADAVKFPFRTILAYAKTEKFDDEVHGLLDTYIPFSFGKKRLNVNNKVEENLKWSKGKNDNTPKYSAYIEELILIAYAYALENDGDIEKCEAVWTYPLSMDKSQIIKFNRVWEGYFEKYFGSKNVEKISESIAPYIYYCEKGQAHNTFGLSIDIGGGTCDVVIIKNNNEQKVTSFRFAADVIFGQGDACDNNMIQNHIFSKSAGYLAKLRHLKQVEEQKQKNNKENLVSEIGQLEELLTRAVEKGESASTASTILFSLENNPIFASFAESKRSYNSMLSKDENFIILFIYFYAAIIYYLTQLLLKLGCEHPKYIIFSGTGSKMLNIIEKAGGGVDDLTANMIGFFSESKLSLNEKDDRFNVDFGSKEEPKQLTAKGAIYHDIDKVKKAVSNITKTTDDCENIIGYTLKDGTAIDNIEMLAKPEIEKEIVDDVKRFNAMFVDFCKKYKIVDEYECNEDDYKIFCNEINRGIDVFFKDEIGNREGEDEFSDVPFFFPIKYIIAELLKELGKSES